MHQVSDLSTSQLATLILMAENAGYTLRYTTRAGLASYVKGYEVDEDFVDYFQHDVSYAINYLNVQLIKADANIRYVVTDTGVYFHIV